MRVLFLYPYPLTESPSQRFRFEQYFEILQHNNIQIKGQSFWNITTWNILYKKGFYIKKIVGLSCGFLRRIKILFYIPHVNIVFIHRECTPIGPPVIEWIIAKVYRKKIIYDFDDAIWLPNTSDENKASSFIKWHSKVKLICQWSYTVSCGNLFLASFAKQFNGNVIINPTTIDTINLHNPSLYKIPNHIDVITIGWTGSHSTVKYFESLLHVFERLEKKYNHVCFIVISNKKPNVHLKSLLFIPWSKESEIEDLLQFDIGVMPLSKDIWASGKCGFKALQYMALGIPTLASPVGVNTEIIIHEKNGFLCNDENDWFNVLCKLIERTSLHEQIGLNARKTVVDSYSVSSNTSTFLSLFE